MQFENYLFYLCQSSLSVKLMLLQNEEGKFNFDVEHVLHTETNKKVGDIGDMMKMSFLPA